MKSYVMAFLKTGPNRDQDSTEAAHIQRDHLDNINRLAEEGKLVFGRGRRRPLGQSRRHRVYRSRHAQLADVQVLSIALAASPAIP